MVPRWIKLIWKNYVQWFCRHVLWPQRKLRENKIIWTEFLVSGPLPWRHGGWWPIFQICVYLILSFQNQGRVICPLYQESGEHNDFRCWLSFLLVLNKEPNNALRCWMMSEGKKYPCCENMASFFKVCQGQKGISYSFTLSVACRVTRPALQYEYIASHDGSFETLECQFIYSAPDQVFFLISSVWHTCTASEYLFHVLNFITFPLKIS